MKMKTNRLVIIFDRFYPEKGTQYLEVTHDPETGSSEERVLSRKPTTARFAEVYETGEGSYNQWNAHLARKLYGYRLEKK